MTDKKSPEEEYYQNRDNLTNLVETLSALLQGGFGSRHSAVVPSIDVVIDAILSLTKLFQPGMIIKTKPLVREVPPWLNKDKNPDISEVESVWDKSETYQVCNVDDLHNQKIVKVPFKNKQIQPIPALVRKLQDDIVFFVKLKKALSATDYKSEVKKILPNPKENTNKSKSWNYQHRVNKT